jgi:hypothetical protein
MLFFKERFKEIKAGNVSGGNYGLVDASGFECKGTAKYVAGDPGNFTAQEDLVGMMQEVYQHLLSAQNTVLIPLGALMLEDGTALTKFADGDSATPGRSQESNKEIVLRWNNHATPTKVGFSVPMPMNLNDGANAVVHIMAAVTGTETPDTPVIEFEAYFNKGDTDCAGADPEITGGVTPAELTNTIALANVPASPSTLTVLFGPKAGELGADDCLVYGVWVEFTGKLLTS